MLTHRRGLLLDLHHGRHHVDVEALRLVPCVRRRRRRAALGDPLAGMPAAISWPAPARPAPRSPPRPPPRRCRGPAPGAVCPAPSAPRRPGRSARRHAGGDQLASTGAACSSISTTAATTSMSRPCAWCRVSGAVGAAPPWAIRSPACRRRSAGQHRRGLLLDLHHGRHHVDVEALRLVPCVRRRRRRAALGDPLAGMPAAISWPAPARPAPRSPPRPPPRRCRGPAPGAVCPAPSAPRRPGRSARRHAGGDQLASTGAACSSISTTAATTSMSRPCAWCRVSGAVGAAPPWAIRSPACRRRSAGQHRRGLLLDLHHGRHHVDVEALRLVPCVRRRRRRAALGDPLAGMPAAISWPAPARPAPRSPPRPPPRRCRGPAPGAVCPAPSAPRRPGRSARRHAGGDQLASTGAACSSISTTAATTSMSRPCAWCRVSGAVGAAPPWAIRSPACRRRSAGQHRRGLLLDLHHGRHHVDVEALRLVPCVRRRRRRAALGDPLAGMPAAIIFFAHPAMRAVEFSREGVSRKGGIEWNLKLYSVLSKTGLKVRII